MHFLKSLPLLTISISFGVHRPRPNAWRQPDNVILAGAGVTMCISINLFATANLPQARPVADSIDTVNALHSKVTKKVAAEGSLI